MPHMLAGKGNDIVGTRILIKEIGHSYPKLWIILPQMNDQLTLPVEYRWSMGTVSEPIPRFLVGGQRVPHREI
jgi:hypothetical protein